MFIKYFLYRSTKSVLKKFSFFKNKSKTPFNYILIIFVIILLLNNTNITNTNLININNNYLIYNYLILS